MTRARSLCDCAEVNAQIRVKMLGRLSVRLVAFILRKGKDFEGKTYASVSKVAKVFSSELSSAIGRPVTFQHADATQQSALAPETSGEAASSSATTMQCIESVQQMQSIVYQAQKAGSLTGSHVTAKMWLTLRFS